MVVNGETDKNFRCGRTGQFPVKHTFPVRSQAPISYTVFPFRAPLTPQAVILKQQWSHIGVFICYLNIDAKKKRIKFAHLWYTPLEPLENCSKPP